MSTEDENLAKAITQPSQASVDGVTVSQRPLGEVVEALKYLNARRAARNPLRFSKIAPGDALGNVK